VNQKIVLLTFLGIISATALAQTNPFGSRIETSLGTTFPSRPSTGVINPGISYGIGFVLSRTQTTHLLFETYASIFQDNRSFFQPQELQSSVYLTFKTQPREREGVWFGGGLGVLFHSFTDGFSIAGNGPGRLGFNLQLGTNLRDNTFFRIRFESPFDFTGTNLVRAISIDYGVRF